VNQLSTVHTSDDRVLFLPFFVIVDTEKSSERELYRCGNRYPLLPDPLTALWVFPEEEEADQGQNLPGFVIVVLPLFLGPVRAGGVDVVVVICRFGSRFQRGRGLFIARIGLKKVAVSASKGMKRCMIPP
jgi:hypothetical protein